MSVWISVLLILISVSGCSIRSGNDVKRGKVDSDHTLYKHFSEKYGDKKSIITGANDIDNDGSEDLIVIYKDTETTNKMIAIWVEKGEVRISDPTPAPIENCRIEWRDIDEKPPVELIVSGSKGVNIGYAIYRWENGDFINLFNESMEDCC